MAAKVWADFDRSAPASDRVARAAHRHAATASQEIHGSRMSPFWRLDLQRRAGRGGTVAAQRDRARLPCSVLAE
jgi:hypothetical protein